MRFFGSLFLSLCLGQLAFAKAGGEMKSLQFGVAIKQYQYSEPSIGVEHKGLLYGLWGEWLWHSSLGNGRTIGDIFFGTIGYEGSICDTNTSLCDPYSSTTFDVITTVTSRLEYQVLPGVSLFSGLGGRYLYDMGNGDIFYRRTGTYVFIPFGGNLAVATPSGDLFFDLQYNFIVYGNIASKLSDANPAYYDVTHSQNGYGYTLSGGLQNNDFSAAMFYEVWSLEESGLADGGAAGPVFEPQNKSTALGLKLGYKF